MNVIGNFLSIYSNSVILGIGLYMALIQAKNLIKVDRLDREGVLVKRIGYIYIVIGIIACIWMGIKF